MSSQQEARPTAAGTESRAESRAEGRAAARTEGRVHLERLGVALQRRGWRVRLEGKGSDSALTVTNPTVPEMFETISCRRAGGSWFFIWPWKEQIGPVEQLGAAARRIRHVLRGHADAGGSDEG